jgi:hypothetical protein
MRAIRKGIESKGKEKKNQVRDIVKLFKDRWYIILVGNRQ